MAKVAKDGRKVKYTGEIKLSSEEDAPMTLALDREVGYPLITSRWATRPATDAVLPSYVGNEP